MLMPSSMPAKATWTGDLKRFFQHRKAKLSKVRTYFRSPKLKLHVFFDWQLQSWQVTDQRRSPASAFEDLSLKEGPDAQDIGDGRMTTPQA